MSSTSASALYRDLDDPERPAEGRKKRPRLILACDNCRRKKSRCVLPPSGPPCTSCSSNHLECCFTEREEYYAERRRNQAAIQARRSAPASGGLLYTGSLGPGGIAGHSMNQAGTRNSSNTFSYGMQADTGQDSLLFAISSSGQDIPEPHPTVLPSLITTFFTQMGGTYPFLSYHDICRQYNDRTLSPLLANCIAALAVPFSDLSAFAGQDLYAVAESYAYHAKSILDRFLQASQRSFTLVQVLILVAWIEYKSSRTAGFFEYTQLALGMAQALGLQDQGTITHMSRTQDEYQRLSAMWRCVLQLLATASSIQGSS